MSSSSKKAEALVKDLSRKPSNRNCFDCNRPGPFNNVNMTHFTFVCLSCSGLHRNFSHKIKTINASSWTDQEAAHLEGGGNKRAAKFWLAKFDGNYQPYGLEADNAKSVENWMKLVYQQKKFVGDVKDNQKEKEEAKERKKTLKASVMKQALADKAAQSGAAPTNGDAPANNTAPAPSSVPKAAADPGLDFLTNISFESPSAPSKPSVTSNGGEGFGDSSFHTAPFGSEQPSFSASPSTSSPSTSSNLPAAASFLANQLKVCQTQFKLEISQLQSIIQTALSQLSAETNGRADAFTDEKTTSNGNGQPTPPAHPTMSKPKAAVDLFADIRLDNGGSGSHESDDDDGNPFGSDDDDDNGVNNNAPSPQIRAMPQSGSTVGMAMPMQSPFGAPAFPPQVGPVGAVGGVANVPPQMAPQMGATGPFYAAPNPGNAGPIMYTPHPQGAGGLPYIPMSVIHPAQLAAQNAFLQQQQQAQLIAQQNAAREQISQQQMQAKRNITDATLFSQLNPL